MTPTAVDPEIATAIKEITHHYIVDGESTPAHVLKARLGKKRHLFGQSGSGAGRLLTQSRPEILAPLPSSRFCGYQHPRVWTAKHEPCLKGDAGSLAILLPNYTVSEARSLAERIREIVRHLELKKHPERIALSVGIASFPSSYRSSEELFQAADDALRDATESGRDRICCAGDKAASASAQSAPGARPGATSSEALRQQVLALQQQIEQERIEAEGFTLAMHLRQGTVNNQLTKLRAETALRPFSPF